MLAAERGLWALSLVPIGFTVAALAAAAAALVHFAADVLGAIDGLWPVLEVGAWYAWLWVGPARALFWLLGWLVFAAVAALAAVVAIGLASVAASPFLDALARRVERLATGRVIESDESGTAALARDVARSIAGEARRMGFFLAITVVLLGAGFVIPGAHVLTGPLTIAVTVLFLPLEYTGYVLDRRRVPFAMRRRWIVSRWPRMVGFGGAAFALCLVPGLNLLAIPGLVVGGTLLAVADPPAVSGAPGAPADPRP
jgi:CysZ protein